MIGNKLEQAIIGVFQQDLSSTYSINQISKILKKSYPLINKKSNFFLRENILKKIDVGRSYQCFLNMRSDKARVLMALNEINKKEIFVQKNKNFEMVLDELSQLSKKFLIDTVLLYKKTIIFVMSDTEKKHEILELSILTKDYTLLFFTRKDFQNYFLGNKDLQKYHIVLYNMDICLNIVAEVVDTLLVEGLIGDKRNTKVIIKSTINSNVKSNNKIVKKSSQFNNVQSDSVMLRDEYLKKNV